jgi:FMN phosphatase YigB (HAD superfamily)
LDALQLVLRGLAREGDLARRRAAGWTYRFELADFYPDAIPCLEACRANGLIVGLAGNQPEEAEAALEQVGIKADFIAASVRWGVEKPSPAFFAKVVAATGREAHEIAYVGDRLDNDVLPAKAAGMTAVFIRRGPWGVVHAQRPEVAQADLVLETLDDLLPELAALGRR